MTPCPQLTLYFLPPCQGNACLAEWGLGRGGRNEKVGVNFISLLIFSTLSHLNLANTDSGLARKVFPFRFQKTNLVKSISVPRSWPQIVLAGGGVQCVASIHCLQEPSGRLFVGDCISKHPCPRLNRLLAAGISDVFLSIVLVKHSGWTASSERKD